MSQVPKELKYTEEHEWLRVLDGNRVEVGITDFAQSELSDIVYVELPEVGKEVRRGEAVATLEAVKTVAEVYSPISGKIVEVNRALEEAPERINQDPYGEGWIFRMEIANPMELESLLSPEQYQKLIQNA